MLKIAGFSISNYYLGTLSSLMNCFELGEFVLKVSSNRLKKMTKGMIESLQRDQTDAIDSYFECVTACSLDNDGVECVTRCVEVHLKSEE